MLAEHKLNHCASQLNSFEHSVSSIPTFTSPSSGYVCDISAFVALFLLCFDVSSLMQTVVKQAVTTDSQRRVGKIARHCAFSIAHY